jgi:hypothetical protein
MKVERFITTIQWGSGIHYIADTYPNEEQAAYSKEYHQKRVDGIRKRNGKGAKPTVRTWKLMEELDV